jgi:hypothetical protein
MVEDLIARNGLDLPVNNFAVSPFGFLEPCPLDVSLDRSVEFGKQSSNEARLVFGIQRSDLFSQFGNSSGHVTSVQPSLARLSILQPWRSVTA